MKRSSKKKNWRYGPIPNPSVNCQKVGRVRGRRRLTPNPEMIWLMNGMREVAHVRGWRKKTMNWLKRPMKVRIVPRRTVLRDGVMK